MSTPNPAVLQSGDEETLAKVKAALADTLGRTRMEFGAGDPTQSPVLTVLPPPPGPYVDRNLALPIVFDISMRGGVCLVTRRDTGAEIVLEGVRCTPLAPPP